MITLPWKPVGGSAVLDQVDLLAQIAVVKQVIAEKRVFVVGQVILVQQMTGQKHRQCLQGSQN